MLASKTREVRTSPASSVGSKSLIIEKNEVTRARETLRYSMLLKENI